MNTRALLIAATVLLAAGATASAANGPDRAERNEARLAALLEGRAAGTPVSCIPQFQADRVEVIEGVAMVFGRGETLYVARFLNPRSRRWNDVVVTQRSGGLACYNDMARTVDRMTGMTTGVLFLDRFVPYRKQD